MILLVLLLQLSGPPVLAILSSLYCLKIQARIEYKVISTTYKLLQSSLPYLHDFITLQPSRSTWSRTLSAPRCWLLQYQDDKPLFSTCCISPVKQASSYPSCCSALCVITSQLFPVVRLCWYFSWRFPFTCQNPHFLFFPPQPSTSSHCSGWSLGIWPLEFGSHWQW